MTPERKVNAGIAYGTRTRVARVKGGSPRPLDERDVRFAGTARRSKHNRRAKGKNYLTKAAKKRTYGSSLPHS